MKGGKKKPRKITISPERLERRQRIFELRRRGAQFREISILLKKDAKSKSRSIRGLSVTQVYDEYKAVVNEVKEKYTQDALEIRIINTERLEAGIMIAMQIMNERDGDPKDKLRAVEVLTKASKELSELYGAKAAHKVEVTGNEGGPLESSMTLVIQGVGSIDTNDDDGK